MMDDLKIPKSKESSAGCETIDAAPNHGNCIEAAPLVDAGVDSGPGHFEGNGLDLKFVPAKE
jgi:hypothetical protein